MEYKIIDNFLSENDLVAFQNRLMNSDFGWCFNQSVAHEDDKNEQHYYFTNALYDRCMPQNPVFNELIHTFLPAMVKHGIELRALIRFKCNMYPSSPTIMQHDWHKDFEYEHRGIIFSVNTCNGATVLEDGTKIDSVANRCLLFDPSKDHASTTCTDQKVRDNINMNFF